MEKYIKSWRDRTYDENFIYGEDARIIMILEIYNRYKKKIDKIYKKIYKRIIKNPNKRYYYIDTNKYSEDEMISFRNFFEYNDFKVSNTKPENKDAYIEYLPITTTGNCEIGISNTAYTLNSLSAIKTTTNDKPIIKPASFYICW